MIEIPQIPVHPHDETKCQHLKHMPAFDIKAAEGLSTAEIRTRWPRFFGECSHCGMSVIMYESYAHYVYGDW